MKKRQNRLLDFSDSGKRIVLVHTDDKFSTLRPGARGTIQYLNKIDNPSVCENQLGVRWDDGSNLMLLIGRDFYRILTESELQNDTISQTQLQMVLQEIEALKELSQKWASSI